MLFFLTCTNLHLQCPLMNHTAPAVCCSPLNTLHLTETSEQCKVWWRKWGTRDGRRGGRSQYKSLCFLPLPVRPPFPPVLCPPPTHPHPPLLAPGYWSIVILLPLCRTHCMQCIHLPVHNCSFSLFSRRTIRRNSLNPTILYTFASLQTTDKEKRHHKQTNRRWTL